MSQNKYLAPGDILRDNYRIVRLIGAGGFGATYEAEHLMLNQRVAIKEFFPQDFFRRESDTSVVLINEDRAELVERLKRKFLTEARNIFRLHQPTPIPGIVRVTDCFEAHNTAYYVMDFIDGPSMADMIKARGHLTPQEATAYITQVAQALRQVHAHKMLHLDIKPGNIMVDPREGRAILIDFGLCKQYDANDRNNSTLVGKSPGFSPVEQMDSSLDSFNAATDVYALGATFYKMLTGETPPPATQRADTDTLKPLAATIPAQVRRAVEEAMRVSRRTRTPDIDAFLRTLTAAPAAAAADDGNTIIDSNTVIDSAPVINSPLPAPQPYNPLPLQHQSTPNLSRMSNYEDDDDDEIPEYLRDDERGGCLRFFIWMVVILIVLAAAYYFLVELRYLPRNYRLW